MKVEWQGVVHINTTRPRETSKLKYTYSKYINMLIVKLLKAALQSILHSRFPGELDDVT